MRENLSNKHNREINELYQDLEKKKNTIHQLQGELGESKLTMKNRLEEFEEKNQKWIKVLEEESKRHIKEINEVHNSYRGFSQLPAMNEDGRLEVLRNNFQKA